MNTDLKLLQCDWCPDSYLEANRKYYNVSNQLDFCGAYCSNDAHLHGYDKNKRKDSAYLKSKIDSR